MLAFSALQFYNDQVAKSGHNSQNGKYPGQVFTLCPNTLKSGTQKAL